METDAGGFAHLLAIEQLAYSGTPVWWPVAFNNSLPETICKFGTPEQKKRLSIKCSTAASALVFSLPSRIRGRIPRVEDYSAARW